MMRARLASARVSAFVSVIFNGRLICEAVTRAKEPRCLAFLFRVNGSSLSLTPGSCERGRQNSGLTKNLSDKRQNPSGERRHVGVVDLFILFTRESCTPIVGEVRSNLGTHSARPGGDHGFACISCFVSSNGFAWKRVRSPSDAEDKLHEDDEDGVYLNPQDEDEQDEESQPRRAEEAPKLGGRDTPGNCRATDSATSYAPTTEDPPLGIDDQEARVPSQVMAWRIFYGGHLRNSQRHVGVQIGVTVTAQWPTSDGRVARNIMLARTMVRAAGGGRS